MTVARKFCRNRNITRNTSTTASTRVSTTLSIEAVTTGVVSYGNTTSIPCGKKGLRLSMVVRRAFAVSRALAPLASFTARPEAGAPLNWALML
ncbi:hypothetical protein D3C73_1361270 [compost metagenome]